jgi:hypothetical protein
MFCNPRFLTGSKVVSLDHMNTGGRKLKRKRTPSKSFGELCESCCNRGQKSSDRKSQQRHGGSRLPKASVVERGSAEETVQLSPQELPVRPADEAKHKYSMTSPRFHILTAYLASDLTFIKAGNFLRGHFVESAAVWAMKWFSRPCSHTTTRYKCDASRLGSVCTRCYKS